MPSPYFCVVDDTVVFVRAAAAAERAGTFDRLDGDLKRGGGGMSGDDFDRLLQSGASGAAGAAGAVDKAAEIAALKEQIRKKKQIEALKEEIRKKKEGAAARGAKADATADAAAADAAADAPPAKTAEQLATEVTTRAHVFSPTCHAIFLSPHATRSHALVSMYKTPLLNSLFFYF